MHRIHSSVRLIALSVGVLAGTAVAAQPATSSSPENLYARAGYPTIGVYVLGNVATPGKWRVEDGAPLIDLLAVSGPATAASPRGGTSESVHVRLYRASGGGSRQLAMESELEQLLTGSQATMPLREGDLVRVSLNVTEPRNRVSFTEVISVVSTIASLAVLAVTLVR